MEQSEGIKNKANIQNLEMDKMYVLGDKDFNIEDETYKDSKQMEIEKLVETKGEVTDIDEKKISPGSL